jgi:hypothetical protein
MVQISWNDSRCNIQHAVEDGIPERAHLHYTKSDI